MANNSKEQIIITALLTYPTVREASAAIGIPEPTIYLKLRNADFKKRYNEAQRQMLNGVTTSLQSKLQEATATIIDIMNDTDAAAQTRLNAARSVFDYYIKLKETTEIMTRLEALETAVNNSGTKRK